MTPKTSSSKTSKKKPVDVMIAKYGLLGTITVAVLGLIGTGITAYLGFLGTQVQIEKPIIATQTAKAGAMIETQIAIQNAIQIDFQSTTQAVPQITTQAAIQRTDEAEFREIISTTQAAIAFQPTLTTPQYPEYTIVYPSCNCDEYFAPYEKVLIRLRWGGKTAQLAEKGADFIKYIVAIDGQDIGDIQNYRRPATLVEDPIIAGDPNDAWWVYWDIPVGRLPGYSSTTIEVKIELLAGIDTGWDVLPVGLEKTYRVVLRMSFPASPTAIPTP
jgi:hypothetical protein